MNPEIPMEKRFKVLTQITRASHFAWRKAVEEMCGDVAPGEVVYRMWKITGQETGNAYLRHIDPDKPLPKQIADSLAWSSLCMGETAEALPGQSDREAYIRHSGCPWYDWHRRLDLLKEDQPGCDMWFKTTIEVINERLGTNVKIETTESLPEGGTCCLRRIWEE
jgi:hypothetical protein